MNVTPFRAPRLGGGFDRAAPPPDQRRVAVTWAKRLLPAGALILLSALALWPELGHQVDQERVTLTAITPQKAGGGELTNPHYQGVDAKGRPYTVTATTGDQVAPDRVNLTDPKGDVSLPNGGWILVQSQRGVFMQHDDQLDLSGDATLYRADGTTMVSDTATVDIRAGVAVSNHLTHAEGPFGMLDSVGFAMADKGAVVQFTGPARMRLNSAENTGLSQPAPAKAGIPAAAAPAPAKLSAIQTIP